MSIDILVPVLGREEALEPLVASIIATTTVPWHLRFLCSPGDYFASEHCIDLAKRDYRISTRIVPWDPGGGDWARKINLGYDETGEEFMLLGATDLRFHSTWDREAIKVADHFQVGVVGTNDLGNALVMAGKHSTHPLVRRSYIDEYGTVDEPGKVLHEGYHHQWVDTEFCQTAMARRQWAPARKSLIEHLHPFWPDGRGGRKGKMDATYEKALSTSRQDQRLYRTRSRLVRKEAQSAGRSASSVPPADRAAQS